MCLCAHVCRLTFMYVWQLTEGSHPGLESQIHSFSSTSIHLLSQFAYKASHLLSLPLFLPPGRAVLKLCNGILCWLMFLFSWEAENTQLCLRGVATGVAQAPTEIARLKPLTGDVKNNTYLITIAPVMDILSSK